MGPLRHRLYRALARSPLAVHGAVVLRNQAAQVFRYHLAEGFTDEGVRRILDRVGPSTRRFVDVGANVGHWAALALAAAPRAEGLLMEPAAGAGAALHARFDGDPRVTVIEAAVSDQAGEVVFNEEEGAGERSSLLAGNVAGASLRRVVRCITLDAELDARGWDTVDYLKVDVEGFDFHVLRGAGRRFAEGRVRFAQFEYNDPWAPAGSTLAAAQAWLEAHGYALYLIRSGGLFRYDYRRHGEVFSYANFLAVAPDEGALVQPLIRGWF